MINSSKQFRSYTKKTFIEKIKDDDLPVIIYGVGATGQVLYHACIESGIEVQSFCDNNIIKCGNNTFK